MPAERPIPDWARRERDADLAWIQENLDVFQLVAAVAFTGTGRGAIVIDTTFQQHPESGHPFAYFSQTQIEEDYDEDTKRMVRQYNPQREFILVLMKEKDRTSTYRIKPMSRGGQENS